MIEISRVTKRFGKRVAVNDVSLTVPRGCIYGLLGHNGAGKSTTMGMLLGQIFPDAGSLTIDGHDIFRDRKHALARVGAIYEGPAFYDYMTGYHNLQALCAYSAPVDRKRIDEVVELVDLKARIHDKVAVYSHGMRQRLALAQALLPNPNLLILDEPSDGLDPQGMHAMRHLVRRLNREWDMTILFSSHLLHEVEQLCDHLAVMHQGRLIYDGEWNSEMMSGRWIRLEVDRFDDAIAAMRDHKLVGKALPDGRVELTDGLDTAGINGWLVERGFRVSAIAPTKRTLEDFYLDKAGYQKPDARLEQNERESDQPDPVNGPTT